MIPTQLSGLDLADIETPAFVIDLDALRQNLERLDRTQALANCKILLALKGFAMWSTFPLVRQFYCIAASQRLVKTFKF